MRKKTLQAVIIALGILGSTFTVSAMGNTSVENAVLQNQNVETEKPGEDGETDSQPESGWIESDKGWQYKDEAGNLLKDRDVYKRQMDVQAPPHGSLFRGNESCVRDLPHVKQN